MSEPVPHLPPEIVDDIIELLHDDRNTLHRCCLVSKSWIPRARRYIFNKITLNSLSLKAWIKSFPDPEKSPAHYARSLVLVGHGMQIEGTGESGWIQSFINVASFAVYSIEDAKLKFFHNLSPAVKSLCVSGSAPVSNILALACSFPFLRDLEVLYVKPINFVDQDGAAFKPSFSPMSARTLTLDCPLEAITTQMSDLPGGPRFEEIVWKFHYTRMTVSEFGWMAALMKECSQTLKYMSICCTDGPLPRGVEKIPIDLSKATKLKGVRIKLCRKSRDFTRMAGFLETITYGDGGLEWIEIDAPRSPVDNDPPKLEASGLDGILVRLWESHAIRTRFAVQMERDVDFIKTAFPQLSKKIGL